MVWIAALCSVLLYSDLLATTHSQRNRDYHIKPKPCWVDGVKGTCMFVYECIKTEGYHIGMCVDTFMFGSCCAHNTSDNFVPADLDTSKPAVLYTPPSQSTSKNQKPNLSHSSSVNNKHTSSLSGRPQHSILTVSLNMRQNGSLPSPSTQSPPRPHNNGDTFTLSNDILDSFDKHGWQTSTDSVGETSTKKPNTAHWQFTTEPDFVTKTKTKGKPTKKPWHATTHKNTIKFQTKTPKPTVLYNNRVKPTTTPSPPVELTTSESSSVAVLPTSTFSSASAVVSDAMKCGMPMMQIHPQTRIVGGRNAPFGRWPWQVSVRRTSFFGFSSTHRCGGAVLNENWIATAGHCVDDLLTSQIRIRVGEYDFSNVHEELPYVERGVAKKVVHPKYNFFTYEYDLALVKLDKALEFAPHISPICLPASDDLLIGENATVTGWGRLSEGGTLPSILQEVNVPIVSNECCRNMFLKAGRHEHIPEIFLCAGHESGGQDSCQGDSGGPLQVRGKNGRFFLAGIISWGIGCAEQNLPGVCTRISKFVPWILKTVT
ncbi:serine proteinase stubble [Agrilus planipennis]|uniref:Serine proteinase stubble n=1 Tax=Agrilus planipennis TaxID=224129 RepID=A0A7F5RIU3_AGRPL|nr:serine proteinase stubble [Agrilus planipennis]